MCIREHYGSGHENTVDGRDKQLLSSTRDASLDIPRSAAGFSNSFTAAVQGLRKMTKYVTGNSKCLHFIN